MYSSTLPVSPLRVFEAFSSVLDDFMHEMVAAALQPLLQHQQVAPLGCMNTLQLDGSFLLLKLNY